MLLQIQVYPAAVGAAATTTGLRAVTPPPPPPSAAVTHTINTSITTNFNNGNGNSTTELWSMGRKQGNFQVQSDLSVSREHIRLLLKVVAAGTNNASTTPEQHLLQIQNVGKLGSSLVIEETFLDPSHENEGDIDGTNKDNDDDSDATVDELLFINSKSIGISSSSNSAHHRSQHSRCYSSQQSILDDVDLSFITKHLTQQTCALVTHTTPRRNYNVRLQRIGPNDSLTVGFYDDDDNDDDENNNNKNNGCDYHHPNRIIVQCGTCGTTIVISRIHFKFVASKVPMKKVLRDMKDDIAKVLGGTVQDTLYRTRYDNHHHHHNNNDNTDVGEADRTFLISAEYHANPKHITAWCRNIPIVRPSFVSSLMDQYRNKCFPSSSHLCTTNDVLPSADFIQQHRLPTTKMHFKFFQQKPNREILKHCTLISPLTDADYVVDDDDDDHADNSNVENIHIQNEKELKEMMKAAGANVITIQSLLKEDDNLFRQAETSDCTVAATSTIRHLLDNAFVDHPTTMSYFTLDTPVMKSQYPTALKILQNMYGIPTLTIKEVALAITEQKGIRERICSFYVSQQQQQKVLQVSGSEDPNSTSNMDQTPSIETDAIEAVPVIDVTPVTRSTRSQRKAPVTTNTRSKRTRAETLTVQHDVPDSTGVATSSATATPPPKRQNQNESNAAEESRATSTRRRRRAIAPNDESFQSLEAYNSVPDESFTLTNHDSPIGGDEEQNSDSPRIKVVNSETPNDEAVVSTGGRSDGCDNERPLKKHQVITNTDGWFTALQQGPLRKSIYREKLKSAVQLDKSSDGDDDDSMKMTCSEPAMTQTLKGMIVEQNMVPNQLPAMHQSGPNYKAFRKNMIPLPTIMTVVNLQPYHATKSRIVLSIDDDAQRSQIEAQQRRADELFR